MLILEEVIQLLNVPNWATQTWYYRAWKMLSTPHAELSDFSKNSGIHALTLVQVAYDDLDVIKQTYEAS